MTLYFNDITNGTYDNVEGIVHPGSSSAWVATAVFQNSAGGSITPQANNWEGPTAINMKCRSLKGTRTTLVLDPGSVNQTNSTTAANPTSGSAAAPGTPNNIVIGAMVRPSAATTTDAAPWTPGGTITEIGSGANHYLLYDHYSIQTTATTANSPMTASSAAFIDTQFAVLNASNAAGTRALTGVFGVPAIAKTNAASATTADLNGATTTLRTLHDDGTGWALNQGSAQTYDTGVSPSGTGSIMLQGVNHTFGDAATSVKFTVATGLTEYLWGGKGATMGQPMYLSAFMRIGSSGLTINSACDSLFLNSGVTDSSITLQAYYNSTDGIYFDVEPLESGSSAQFKPSSHIALDTDFRPMLHMAGTNEQNHQLIIQQKSGGVWSTTDTFNYPVLCEITGAALCDTAYLAAHAQASGTGSASSGSTSMTVTSGSGTVTVGYVVTGTGIAWPTTVNAVTNAGICTVSCVVTLSQNSSGAVSGTVTFNTRPTTIVSATNGTVTGGSTAMTIVAATFGTPAVGQPMGGAGLAPGTYAAGVSGTSITLSQKAVSTMPSGAGVTFWQAANALSFGFGRYSTCLDTAAHWYSGFVFDPFNDWGAFVPN